MTLVTLIQKRESEKGAPDRFSPLSHASEGRRQNVLAMSARDGRQYAILVEDPNTDPAVAGLATPDGTCELLIARDRYDAFAILAMVAGWNREARTWRRRGDQGWPGRARRSAGPS